MPDSAEARSFVFFLAVLLVVSHQYAIISARKLDTLLILHQQIGDLTWLTRFILIVLPPALGEYVLTGSAVAIQLAINLIGDVVITTYESVATLTWGRFRDAVTH